MIRKTLLLSSLAAMPLISNGSLLTTIDTTSSHVVSLQADEQQEQKEPEACTFMYVGKDVSESGKAIISRCGDRTPTTMNMYSRVFQHNELANKTVEGKNGFKWTMPSTTYKYAATPRNPNMGLGLNWEVSGINENGVCCSATLSCYTYDTLINKENPNADPFTDDGLGEDNLTQIIAATATSARNGIETVAKILDNQGACEANAIMIGDKNESWYMEIYTGHQYCAIKLPDDKACTMGNEFILETLANYDDSNIIHSERLLDLPKMNNCAIYDGGEDLKHLHLYSTYAEMDYKDAQGVVHHVQGGFDDACHMRTWIGQYRFGRNQLTENQKLYENCKAQHTGKLNAFWTPDRKLSENDVISYMRDRFETILDDETDQNYAYFKANEASLRVVGTETTYQVHIMSVDPNLPTEMCIDELLCVSNASYAPFIPVNNAINSFNSYYETKTPEYSFDTKSAISIYKRLNALAATNRKLYGLPIEKYIHEHELIWQVQYKDMINQVKDLSSSQIQQVMTNFCSALQAEGLLMSNTLFNDLLFHIENTTKGKVPTATRFQPLVSLQWYGETYGWNYSYDSNTKIATLSRTVDGTVHNLKIDLNYQGKDPNCDVFFDDFAYGTALVHISEDVPYVEHTAISPYIITFGEVSKFNYVDFLDQTKGVNVAMIVVPVVVGAALIACALVIPYVLNKRRTKKEVPPQAGEGQNPQ